MPDPKDVLPVHDSSRRETRDVLLALLAIALIFALAVWL